MAGAAQSVLSAKSAQLVLLVWLAESVSEAAAGMSKAAKKNLRCNQNCTAQ